MRISCTTIDQYRRFLAEEYVSEADLIESIKGEFRPTRKMKAGSSFEKVMELPEKYRNGDFYSCEGFDWPAEAIDSECLTHFSTPGTWQCKEVRPYIVGTDTVNIVTKVDQLVANYIKECKVTQSPFDYEKYHDAHQWRWYNLNFGAAFVRYKVFYFTEVRDGMKFHDAHSFDLYPYTGMLSDCLEALAGLVDFIHSRKLESFVADDHPRLLRGVA